MNKYELTIVVNAKIEDDERAAVVNKAKGYIERFGGKITNVDEAGKKKLAYDIQKMSEAFYYIVHFESEDSNCSNEMEQQLRIMDGVLRYLIVREDEE